LKKGRVDLSVEPVQSRARRDSNPGRKLRRLVSFLGLELSRLDYGPIIKYEL
jgi:hypothetical protein